MPPSYYDLASGNADGISVLPGMSVAQRNRVLYEFNDTAVPYLGVRRIDQLVAEQVTRTPEAIAVSFEGELLTYCELDARANQLAWWLRKKGVNPNELVGICMERSLEMVVGLLGILKAGGAYVPLDPSYPHERLAYMLEDAAPRVVLTQSRLKERLPSSTKMIAVDGEWKEIGRHAASELPGDEVGLRADQLAYVIYTSGSTGRPKGAMNEHGAVVNRLLWMREHYPLDDREQVLQKTPYSFDVSVWEFFWPLITGARLVVARPGGHRDPAYLMDLIEATGITRVHFVPSMLQAFLGQHCLGRCSSVRQVICSGEELTASLQNKCLEQFPQARLLNLYGPTECAIEVTAWECAKDPAGGRVPIGRPIANTRIYVLDRRCEPLPIGVPGEIYIAGVQVGRGYLNRPELTAERFVPDPFSADPKARMYKTGDLGRWRPDGAIEYLGRNDEQVKIRGFRIELGEIEAQLVRHADVKEAVVLAREDEPGQKRLVAYVIGRDPAQKPSAEVLREHSKEVLPEYMVPSAFVAMEAFPLTSSGKLDRRSLPVPDQSAYTRPRYEAPVGEVEEMLAGIWQQLLKADRVGRNDNFFELGGDSLVAVRMTERLRHIGLTASAQQIYVSPTPRELALAIVHRPVTSTKIPPNIIPTACERITREMLPLIELEEDDIDSVVQTVPGGSSNIQDIYPLLPLQQGLLFHHLLGRGRREDVYVISKVIEVSSRQKLDEFIAALQTAVRRHDSLRTAVVWENLRQPVQVVYRSAEVPIGTILLEANRDSVDQLMERAISGDPGMELAKAPLMRLIVAQDPGGDRWFALLQIHHLICDEESLGSLFSEISAILNGQTGLPVPAPYRDHVGQVLSGTRMSDAGKYFREKLGDVNEPTAPFSLLDVRSGRGHLEEAQANLPSELARRLRTEARRRGVSPATLFHAAWALVVSRTAAREDVVYGTVLLGRLQEAAGTERMLGMFVNTLPVRVNLEGISVSELVERTGRELMQLLSYEQASLADAQKSSGVAASVPLFTSLLNYRHGTGGSSADLRIGDGIAVVAVVQRSHYPITLSVDDFGADFLLTAQTDSRIEAGRVLAYATTALQHLVDALEHSSSIPALSLEVLPITELDRVVGEFNGTKAEYPSDSSISEIFDRRVLSSPKAVAVRCEGVSLTYLELNRKANYLAACLRKLGVEPGEYVPILMPRSLAMLIAQIAVLKCGGAYVPLDPETPVRRLAFILRDCGARHVLALEASKPDWVPGSAEWVDCATTDEVKDLADESESAGVGAESPACIMYTSGSTGVPKGVVVPHRAISRLVINSGFVRINETDCLPHCSNPAFDASTFEIWGALLNGARVLIVPQSVVLDAPRLAELLVAEQATVMWMTVGLLKQYQEALAEVLSRLRCLITGGDVVDPEMVRRVLQRSPPEELLNGYGPTECTTFATTHRIDLDGQQGASIPIGRPISNTAVYVLDRRLRPLPVGVAGELFIGGDGVALGYLSRPELTAERFVPNPFSADPRARMYKTGDLGRWRPDGTIEYLGRNDEQVKIRGFRIELGEIEAQLVQHVDVKEAVVLAREDEPGEKRLVGYLIARDPARTLSAEVLREHLKGVLPEYMVPGAFVTMKCFPLTANGKLDRRALPAPDRSAYMRREYAAPLGEIEEILADIWQDLLKVERIGRNDNFFELGGHSLLIVQMLERLRRVGLSAEVRRVFETPRLSALAETLIRGAPEINVPPNLIPPGCERITPGMLPLVKLEQEHIDRIVHVVPGGAANVQDIYPLAPLQEGMLFHHLLDQHRGDTYVLSTLLLLSSKARLQRLTTALQAVIDRHDILRTAILWERLPNPVQVVHRRATLLIEEIALDSDRDSEEQIKEWLQPRRQRLDLTRAPLVRMQIAATRDGTWYALLQFHHVTIDHVTMERLISEAVAYLENPETALPDPVPYRQHVAQALALINSHEVEEFFRGKLADVEGSTAPFGVVDVYEDGSEAEEIQSPLDDSLAKRLRRQARRMTVSAATLFHAAWALVVSCTSGRDDVVFGTILLGRSQGPAGAGRTLGVFINTLPIRLKIEGISARGLVDLTRDELIDLIGHEQASLAMAQRCSGVGAGQPLFTTLLNYRHSVPNPDSEWTSAAGIQQLAYREQTNYPVLVSVDDLGEGFALTVQTDPRIKPHRIMDYLVTTLTSLVEALEHSPQTLAAALQVLPEDERRAAIESPNTTLASYPLHKLIHERFEEQAAATPHATAVEHAGRRLTYAQLNRRANQLARYLVGQDVGPDRVVGICMERGLEMIVGMLGTLKAGGAYLPLDPNYPVERLSQMIEDASPQIVLTETELVGVLPAGCGPVIAVDDKCGQIGAYIEDNLSPGDLGLTSENLVYAIYTSGSTGRPKGTAMRHRSMVNLIEWHRSTFGAADGRRVLQFAALSFDVAFQEIFSTLCTGGTLVLLDEWVRRDAQALVEVLIKQSIHRLFLPPLMLQSMAEYCKSANRIPENLQDVITAGEQLRISPVIRDFFERIPGCRLHNHYGPTETHVVTALTLSDNPSDWPTLPSVGRPIANTKIFVLNRWMQAVPIGVPGEIYIGGANVARGYLHRPDLTNQRFVANPCDPNATERLYKTGDLGRWTKAGQLEFLGRNDDQVKIRGFRVELQEVEGRLAQHESVKEAAVIVREDVPGDRRLVGYVIGKPEASSPSSEGLRAHMKEALPEYMVPSAFVLLEAFPVTASGKLDRRALPAPDQRAYARPEYEPPRGEVEEILAGIWQEVLQLDRVDRRDNFFEVGGHSLSATQVAIRIRSALSIDLQIRAIFKHRTLKDLGMQVSELCQSQRPATESKRGEDRQSPELRAASDNREVLRATRELQPGVSS